MADFDLAVILNYYSPYVSGLTDSAREIAEGLAGRGWRVAVVASQHKRSLPRRERRNGVEIFRCPVVTTISRGPVSLSLPFVAGQVARASSVANLHIPMLEAGPIARLCAPTPVVTTYHIDLWLRPSLVSPAVIGAVDTSARMAMRRSAAVVVNSDDQARHSRLWPTMRRSRVHAIPAPCQDRTGGSPSYREGPGLHVGFAGRIAAEKGLAYLVRAFRRLPDQDARLLLAGDYIDVAGGSDIESVRRAIGDDPRVRLLGLLNGRQMRDFYASIDVFALPSISESFGIVQAEAMMAGIPSVTTDIPGGRVPVTATGFGRVIPPRDPAAIFQAIQELRDLPVERRATGARDARAKFGLQACLDAYEDLFQSLGAKPGIPGNAQKKIA
ncbi:glycosyltransferase family 4 protein [Sphaerisporangium sp. NPDC049002]|uniref:glycosyltransferase family 4 protein n=1 Tax=unclassified Sphaerisporangium TaxID=2630420 RepID=UPI0033C9F74A